MAQSLLTDVPAWLPVRALVTLVSVAGSVVAVRYVTGVRLGDRLRARLLLGVPWGTLLTMGAVLAVYLFVQGAWWHPRPLVTPFRTWSYHYPLGMLTGAFTHSGRGHVTGNLLGTLVFGGVAEYAWSHYPQRRGVQTFSSLRTNPFARALAMPAAAVVVGIFTALFAVGPVVGFSGVVFAMAGAALVARPKLFLGALLAGRVVDLVYVALLFPEPTVGGRTRFVTPWWADVAIQGHAIGVLAGVLVGAALLWYHSERPQTLLVFFAALVFAVVQNLWAVYLPVGGGEYTLFRWLGTAGVFLLAVLVGVGTMRTDRRLLPRFERDSASLAALALLVALGALSLAAVPSNLATVGPEDYPENGVEVRDYVVGYAEQTRNEYAASIPVPFGEERTEFNESGVVVASDRREVWITAVQKGSLAVNGRATVIVGGPGWREQVYANRSGWSVLGNRSVYTVGLRRDGGEFRTVFTSPPSTADVTLAGRNVTFRPGSNATRIVVRRGNETLARGPVPANMSQRRIGGITFERNRSRLYAAVNGTRVQVAERETDRRR